MRKLAGADMVLVGSAGQTTVREAVQTIVDATGARSPVSAHQTARSAFLIDSSKATRLFGFAPMEILAALRQFASDNG
jgi:nucleoside-diphosphate-sugar epimerase